MTILWGWCLKVQIWDIIEKTYEILFELNESSYAFVKHARCLPKPQTVPTVESNIRFDIPREKTEATAGGVL